MSLINDYLDKTQRESPRPEQSVDVPPILISSRKERRRNSPARLAAFIGIGVMAVAVYFVSRSSTQEITLPPEIAGPIKQVSRQASLQASAHGMTQEAVSPPVTLLQEILPEAGKRPSTGIAEELAADLIRKKREKRLLSLLIETQAPGSEGKGPSRRKLASSVPEEGSSPAGTGPPVMVTSRERPAKPATADVDISHLYQIGLMAQKDGDLRAAERYYGDVLEKDSSHAEALTNLSAIYVQQGRFSDAEKYLSRILRIDPGNSGAFVNLGIINLERGLYKEADNLFREALRINQGEERALVNLAFLARRKNDLALTEEYYRKILAISPDDREVILSYASLLEKCERFEKALSYYRKSLDLEDVKADVGLVGRIKERINLLVQLSRKLS